MFAICLILLILDCLAFCYLFFKQLETDKDINILYENYSKQLENITKDNIKRKGSVLK